MNVGVLRDQRERLLDQAQEILLPALVIGKHAGKVQSVGVLRIDGKNRLVDRAGFGVAIVAMPGYRQDQRLGRRDRDRQGHGGV